MTDRAADLKKVRSELRGMSRGNLLIIAERAAEIVPTTELKALLGGFVRIEALAETRPGATPLLDEVREFHSSLTVTRTSKADLRGVPLNTSKT
jgi:hypothetical protein